MWRGPFHLDGAIPGTSNEFVNQVSSRAYDMRRYLQQLFDSSSMTYWRPTHAEKPHSLYIEVERECGLLVSYGGKWRPEMGNQAKQSRMGIKFQIILEDIREACL
ncbi:hypothetical protein GH714_030854 [Hevea brasiliensis]|uniref:Uncharacterized protein n=1 Tax=Hevea brasiliensis TaxID=3981 RepID=A0A6A6LCI9_HEVBR|nr:hypothetical protein GH714_030854 [Hevea brasiliensis]